MRSFVVPCWMLLAIGIAEAVENGQVMYVGGTLATVKEGAIGRLDTTLETELRFQTGRERLEIPFQKIESYSYTQEVARHLGVLPAIGAGLLRHRQRKHFFRVSFRDENGRMQVAVFEVPKEMPRGLLAVLQTRAPRACVAPATACILNQ